MALLKGSNLPPQAQEGISDNAFEGMSAEQKREIELGLKILKLRRWLRIICIVLFPINAIVLMTEGEGFGMSILKSGAMSIFGYIICVYVYVYIIAGNGLKLYYYLRDLFGGSKETRL